jgi:putative PIN family toxin of toxin-antitoxin system
MKVVIDTNILLVSISRRSPFHWIFERLLQGEYALCVSNEILSEYAEIIEFHMGSTAAEVTLQAILELPNTEKTDIYFRWNLLKDADDNKFSDCAIASGADYLVTHDKGFAALQSLDFPKVKVVSAESFKLLLA